MPISRTANQQRNLFCGQATLQCLAATLMRLARHAVYSSFERFEKVGFICLSNANQARGFLRIGQRKEAVTPKKGSVAMHPANFCTVVHTLTFGQLLCVFQQLFLMAQTSQRCAGQRIEGGAIGSAAITLQPRSRTPSRNVIVTALRGTMAWIIHDSRPEY